MAADLASHVSELGLGEHREYLLGIAKIAGDRAEPKHRS